MTVDVVITGGGTAGHTNPGIAVAQALVARGLSRSAIRFVGGEHGNEATIVPAAGFEIDLLPGRGIRRSLSRANVEAIAGLARGGVRAVRLLRRLRPQVVVCLGGYASLGASFAAGVLRIPVVVSEQNARASATNRLVARFADICAVPFPDTDLPKAVLTGNPVRAEVVEAIERDDRGAARRRLGVPDDAVLVAVWSGSLGARSVNRAVAALVERWSQRAHLPRVVVHHVIGRRDWAEHRDRSVPRGGPVDLRLVEYEDDMPTLLAAADLAVCRAGASTVTELAIAGVPAVLVPLPGAPRDHQRANTAELVGAGGAIVVDDADLSAKRLDDVVLPLLTDRAARLAMAAASRSVGRPRAAEAVADLVIDRLDPSTRAALVPADVQEER